MMEVRRLLGDVAKSFLRHGCGSLAASLAYFSLLSLFPLVFLLLYGVSFIVSHEVIGGQVLISFLKGFLPILGERLAEELQRIGELETVRWLVFLSFLWFGALVFYELDYTLNVVFESTRQRHPLISTIITVTSLSAVGLLMILSYVATQAVNFMTAYVPHLWGLDLLALQAHDFFLTYTLPFALAFITVTGLYRYVPRRRPEWREAMIGAITFSLLWVAAKLLFITYRDYATLYSHLYGSLVEVVLLLLWLYYSAALFLFGAVLAHALQQRAQAVAGQLLSQPTPSSI
jgi:membrane protein